MIVTDVQNWFNGNQKVAAILNKMCLTVCGQTRKFLWVPETRFVKLLLLLKRFKRLMGALQATVENDVSKALQFIGSSVDDMVSGDKRCTAVD